MAGMFDMDREKAEELMRDFAEALDEGDSEPVEMLVCGAMSLVLQGMLNRPTRDIDAVAVISTEKGRLKPLAPIVDRRFTEARARVALAHGMPDKWLNFQSRTLLDNGLPDGIVERGVVFEYGPKLRIRLCSRLDMVALKMWGSMSVERERDIEDLIVMKTADAEVMFAVNYCLGKDADKRRIKEVLERIGHGDMARELDQTD